MMEHEETGPKKSIKHSVESALILKKKKLERWEAKERKRLTMEEPSNSRRDLGNLSKTPPEIE